MVRLLSSLLLLGAATASASDRPSADETALFLLTQKQGVEPDRHGTYAFDGQFPAESGDPSERFGVRVTFHSTAPCHYAVRILRTRYRNAIKAGETWSQMLVELDKASRLEFKPLYDDHGPNTYVIVGAPRLMCVRDAVMADCSDRITVQEDPQAPFARAKVQEAFDRLHAACPEQPS
jgi:hypothetical protein